MIGRLAKRTFDVALAAVLLLVSLPILLMAVALSVASLRAWPFFTQERIGRGGETFRFLKIRTLPPHMPKYARKYDLDTVQIPRLMLLLRELHLDELPQLFLVLTGKMSLVGPRPEMPNLYEAFPPEVVALRTDVRPGCTGLWQVSTTCGKMIYEHPEFDTYYVNHRSLRFDVWIMWHTVRVHLPGGDKHLVDLASLPRWTAADASSPFPPAPSMHAVPATFSPAMACLDEPERLALQHAEG